MGQPGSGHARASLATVGPVGDESAAVPSDRLVLVVLITVVAGVATEAALHGTDLDRWGAASNTALVVAAGIATLSMAWRATVDRRASARLFALATGSWALAQLLRVTMHVGWGIDTWPSAIDASFVVVPLLVLGALFIRLWRYPSVRRMALAVDSVVMAVSIVFVIWELWLRDRAAGLAVADQLVLVGLPVVDIAVASLAIVMVLQQRSPTILVIAALLVCFAAGDTISSLSGGPFGGGGIAAVACWGAFLVLLTALAGRASRRGEDSHRPEVIRMVAVYLPATVSMTMAVSMYLIGDHPVSAFSGALSIVFVLAVTIDQGVRAWESSEYSQQLTRTIGELGTKERQLRNLLDDLPEAVVVIDRGGVIRDANAAAQRLTARSADELIGRDFRDLIAASSRDLAASLWQHVQAGGGFDGAPVNLPLAPPARPDLIVAVDAMLPVRDPEEVVVSLRDVSASLREAAALERARERFRLAFHGAPDGHDAGDRRHRPHRRRQRHDAHDDAHHPRRTRRQHDPRHHPPRRLGAQRPVPRTRRGRLDRGLRASRSGTCATTGRSCGRTRRCRCSRTTANGWRSPTSRTSPSNAAVPSSCGGRPPTTN